MSMQSDVLRGTDMDRSVTVRFFEVQKEEDADPSFLDLLNECAAKNLPDRQADLGNEVMARLERLEVDGNDHVSGEIIRMQERNLPGEALPEGLAPLPVDGPLGHSVAFRLNHAQSIIAVQYAPQHLAPARLTQYLYRSTRRSTLKLVPILRHDNWERFANSETRKIEITIANPANMQLVANDDEPVTRGIQRMSEAYEGPIITVEIGMGRKDGSLSAGVKDLARQLLDQFALGRTELRKMQVRTSDGDDPEINLMQELLSDRRVLELPDNDPNRSYRLRKDYLAEVMTRHGY